MGEGLSETCRAQVYPLSGVGRLSTTCVANGMCKWLQDLADSATRTPRKGVASTSSASAIMLKLSSAPIAATGTIVALKRAATGAKSAEL